MISPQIWSQLSPGRRLGSHGPEAFSPISLPTSLRLSRRISHRRTPRAPSRHTPPPPQRHMPRTSPRYSPPDSAQMHTPAPCQRTPQSSHGHTPPASSRNSPQIRPQRLSLELRPRRGPGLHLAFRSHSQPGLLLTLADHHVCGFVLHNRWDLMDLSAQMVALEFLSGLFNLDGGAAPLKSHEGTTWSD